jgi:tRNA dimethylallyltransferase
MSSSAVSAGADVGRALTTIPVICGPTASGKSAVAMWLSLRREITIVSADSRQIYRRFDIGTAKPSPEERQRVPHRGIDIVEPSARYSAADWSTMATAAIDEALANGRIPVVVGGTGFYIASLVRPLFAEPPLDAGHRRALQGALESEETSTLRRWCTLLDPARAHLGRVQLLRALEVLMLTGERLSNLHVNRARPSAYSACYLLVDPGSELQARIASRAAAMFDAGWTEEVRALQETVPDDAPAWKGTGYDVVRQLVRGEVDQAAALERVIIDTRQYAKRQRTWFRRQLDQDAVVRLSPTASGWQEVVDRWFTGVEGKMRASRDGASR